VGVGSKTVAQSLGVGGRIGKENERTMKGCLNWKNEPTRV